MPSNRGAQRAASNPAKRDNSSLSSRNFVRVYPDYRDLLARPCEACPGATTQGFEHVSEIFSGLSVYNKSLHARPARHLAGGSGPGAW